MCQDPEEAGEDYWSVLSIASSRRTTGSMLFPGRATRKNVPPSNPRDALPRSRRFPAPPAVSGLPRPTYGATQLEKGCF